MLHKYEPHFDQLTAEQAYRIASALCLPSSEPPTGSDLYEMCASAGLDQATVVLSLRDDFTVSGVQAIETLIGKPIQRVPLLAPAVKHATPHRKAKVVHTGPSDLRVIVAVRRPNPKRAGSESAARYNKYKIGMTVEEALIAGLTTGDIEWDTSAKRAFVELGEPGVVPPNSEMNRDEA